MLTVRIIGPQYFFNPVTLIAYIVIIPKPSIIAFIVGNVLKPVQLTPLARSMAKLYGTLIYAAVVILVLKPVKTIHRQR